MEVQITQRVCQRRQPVDHELAQRLVAKKRLTRLSFAKLQRKLKKNQISHMTLANKFNGLFPFSQSEAEEVERILDRELAKVKKALSSIS